MSEQPNSANERLVELTGRSAGEASAMVVELATTCGYSVVATAPGTYRLARSRRKMLVVKQIESATITISEDRNGTRARVVGPVDDALIEHLGGPATVPTTQSGAGIGVAPVPSAPVADLAPSQQAPPPPLATSASPSQPATGRPATGLITTPSWDQAAAKSPPPSQPPNPPEPTSSPDPLGDEPDDRTVARSTLRAEQPTVPSITLPDGRVILLTTSILVGRDPDPERGPADAVALAIANPSLSKTHALVEADAAAIWITDLHSTNGTTLEGAGPVRLCEAGARTRLVSGTVARFGDVVVTAQGVT